MLPSFISLLTLVVYASADCSRASLQAATARYVTAQSKGAGLTGLTSNFTYRENDAAVNTTRSILNLPLNITQTRSIHDTVACSSFTEIIAAGLPHQYVIGTRILYNNAAKNGTLLAHTIESIVTKPGDWAFDAPGYLRWNSIENWTPIPEGQRDSPAVIKAAGDAYFDRFDNVNVTVPFGKPCARLEGGAYTGASALRNNTCDIGGLPSNIKVTNRRYVIDEVMGMVDIFLGFPGLDRSVADRPVPDSHMFRVEGGKIRYIHTVSACFNAGCGMNSTIFSREHKRVRRVGKVAYPVGGWRANSTWNL
ncbi:hypothetical protein CONLIGDRAFT_687963 [Coniochaeta ligniaria NRRL 30616]|uniref:DUF8021 domain-containing protein n=1 Tax=Coniochaeta ligniaria NRRL 30616 TaxID=1408157 RepID=A0A1J7J4G7_9PEZI|nr:hypothetical protein CONLIGDRAFT_687963 [Coniochaeta ligniaria NRRL 30616]